MRDAKRIFIAVVCAALLLSGCSPRLIGEERTKEAGLALLNQVFKVNETEATVEYEEWPGVTYEDGQAIYYGTEELIRVYEIRVESDENSNSRYYAEVDAVTGEATRAEKAWEPLSPMTSEQQARAEELYSQEETWSTALHAAAEAETNPKATKWVEDVFHPDAPMLPLIFFLSEGDSFLRNGIDVDFYVVLIDGTIYSLNMVWPTFEVLSITRVS